MQKRTQKGLRRTFSWKKRGKFFPQICNASLQLSEKQALEKQKKTA